MRQEFKERLQDVYRHILAGVTARNGGSKRKYYVKPGSELKIQASVGFINHKIAVEEHDIGFIGNPGRRIPEIERFVQSLGIRILVSEDCPKYGGPAPKSVHMPKFVNYVSPSAYYSNLFHELTHFSRDEVGGLCHAPASPGALFEEVIAQLGSELLMSKFGIEEARFSAAYVQGYLSDCPGDQRELFNKACRLANEAVERLEALSTKRGG